MHSPASPRNDRWSPREWIRLDPGFVWTQGPSVPRTRLDPGSTWTLDSVGPQVVLDPGSSGCVRPWVQRLSWTPAPSVVLDPGFIGCVGPWVRRLCWTPAPSVVLDPGSVGCLGPRLRRLSWPRGPTVMMDPGSIGCPESSVARNVRFAQWRRGGLPPRGLDRHVQGSDVPGPTVGLPPGSVGCLGPWLQRLSWTPGPTVVLDPGSTVVLDPGSIGCDGPRLRRLSCPRLRRLSWTLGPTVVMDPGSNRSLDSDGARIRRLCWTPGPTVVLDPGFVKILDAPRPIVIVSVIRGQVGDPGRTGMRIESTTRAMVRASAFECGGVSIRMSCAPARLRLATSLVTLSALHGTISGPRSSPSFARRNCPPTAPWSPGGRCRRAR